MFNKLSDYIRGTRAEFRHVKWPTKQQTVNFTIVVIVIALLVAAALGLFDVVFGRVLAEIIFRY